jgi:hypothetical protein
LARIAGDASDVVSYLIEQLAKLCGVICVAVGQHLGDVV